MADAPNVERKVSCSRNTVGAVEFTGEHCHLHYQRNEESRVGNVRLNINGIWTVLCTTCRATVIDVLQHPEPNPNPPPDFKVGDKLTLDYNRRYVDEPGTIHVTVVGVGGDFFDVNDGSTTWSVLHVEIAENLVTASKQ